MEERGKVCLSSSSLSLSLSLSLPTFLHPASSLIYDLASFHPRVRSSFLTSPFQKNKQNLFFFFSTHLYDGGLPHAGRPQEGHLDEVVGGLGVRLPRGRQRGQLLGRGRRLAVVRVRVRVGDGHLPVRALRLLCMEKEKRETGLICKRVKVRDKFLKCLKLECNNGNLFLNHLHFSVFVVRYTGNWEPSMLFRRGRRIDCSIKVLFPHIFFHCGQIFLFPQLPRGCAQGNDAPSSNPGAHKNSLFPPHLVMGSTLFYTYVSPPLEAQSESAAGDGSCESAFFSLSLFLLRQGSISLFFQLRKGKKVLPAIKENISRHTRSTTKAVLHFLGDRIIFHCRRLGFGEASPADFSFIFIHLSCILAKFDDKEKREM